MMNTSFGVERHRAERHEGVGLHGEVLVRPPPIAELVEDDVAQRDRQPDRHDHHRHQPGSALAQWPPEPDVHRRADRHRRSPSPAARRASRWMPTVELSHHATTAPIVIISEWAKLTRPVVAKISDSPIAHMPMIRPNWSPLDREPRRTVPHAVADPGARRLGGPSLGQREQHAFDVAAVEVDRQLRAVGIDEFDPLGKRGSGRSRRRSRRESAARS